MTTPTAEDSRALLERFDDKQWEALKVDLAAHLRAALDREAALIAERDAARAEVDRAARGAERVRLDLMVAADISGRTAEYAERLGALLRGSERSGRSRDDAAAQMAEAMRRAERKLAAYVGVCAGDKELTGAVLPMTRAALAAWDATRGERHRREDTT